MYVRKIHLLNYRNYKDQKLELDKNINLFISPNAQGKTNILESLYILSTGFSHRVLDIKNCINFEKKISIIEAYYVKNNIEKKIKYLIDTQLKNKIYINNNLLKSNEIIGKLTTVFFCPEDLLMTKGSPKLRRKFLDNEISQANKLYYKNLLKFNKILFQRNSMLKNIGLKKSNKELLIEWDKQFIIIASNILKKRIETLKRISMLTNLLHRKLTNGRENIVLKYKIFGIDTEEIKNDIEPWYEETLKKNTEADIIKGTTSIGPQKDDFNILINGKDSKFFGSQGQQRTCILALKLAEIEFIRSETGDPPILLLDDVMSELDEERRNLLLDYIKGKVQSLITATDKSYFYNLHNIKIFNVNSGKIF